MVFASGDMSLVPDLVRRRQSSLLPDSLLLHLLQKMRPPRGRQRPLLLLLTLLMRPFSMP